MVNKSIVSIKHKKTESTSNQKQWKTNFFVSDFNSNPLFKRQSNYVHWTWIFWRSIFVFIYFRIVRWHLKHSKYHTRAQYFCKIQFKTKRMSLKVLRNGNWNSVKQQHQFTASHFVIQYQFYFILFVHSY